MLLLGIYSLISSCYLCFTIDGECFVVLQIYELFLNGYRVTFCQFVLLGVVIDVKYFQKGILNYEFEQLYNQSTGICAESR